MPQLHREAKWATVKKERRVAYGVGASPIAGQGLFAQDRIAADERVIDYAGELIGKRESRRRQAARARDGGGVVILELDARWDIDGGAGGNEARFLNHSCEPNCEAVALDGRVWICATREIAAGEELTFDYGFRLADFPGHRCRCGAKSCAGCVVNREDRRRVRRWLGRRGRSILGQDRAPSQRLKTAEGAV